MLHKCGLKCIKGIKVSHEDLKGLSPLSIPLLCGWHRQLCKYSKGKKVILYQAPCGVRLRNMEELHRYLRVTGSTLSVDLFDFDYWVRAFADFVVEKCFINIKVNYVEFVLTLQNLFNKLPSLPSPNCNNEIHK